MKHKLVLAGIALLALYLAISCDEENRSDPLIDQAQLVWQEGFLDIHFIHASRGNASFMIFPDGTSMLYDAGDQNPIYEPDNPNPNYLPFLQDGKSVGQRIADYVQFFNPNEEIDYAVISHFHSDHYGDSKQRPFAQNGNYQLTGITEVGDLMKINTLIDRGYPNYQYPVDRRSDSTFLNYLNFIEYHTRSSGLKVESLVVGKSDQITLKRSIGKFSEFEVRNVFANQYFWTGIEDEVEEYVWNPPFVREDGYYNENGLSIVLKISYGLFDYFVGGDIPGRDRYPDYDLESKLAPIIGEVDALSLNHHGHHDASNAFFLNTLNPQVIAHQGRHDPHFPEAVLQRLSALEADVFTMALGNNILKREGARIDEIYQSRRGHFFIRVYPGGNEFKVMVLDPDQPGFKIKAEFGPYKAR